MKCYIFISEESRIKNSDYELLKKRKKKKSEEKCDICNTTIRGKRRCSYLLCSEYEPTPEPSQNSTDKLTPENVKEGYESIPTKVDFTKRTNEFEPSRLKEIKEHYNSDGMKKFTLREIGNDSKYQVTEDIRYLLSLIDREEQISRSLRRSRNDCKETIDKYRKALEKIVKLELHITDTVGEPSKGLQIQTLLKFIIFKIKGIANKALQDED